MTNGFFQQENRKRALVLGGGGAKGAFEVGVWKALKEIEWQPDIITGTSVGALNGALFILGNVDEAEKMWKEIETGKVFDYKTPLEITRFKDYRKTVAGFIIKVIREKGISSKPLKEMILSYINDEEAIRESGIEFGLSATNLATKEIDYLFLEDIKQGKLIDFLLASSSLYPAIQKTVIEGTPYIDGGYLNNIPIGMALDKKPDQLIIVDVKGPGLIKYDNRLNECETKWIRTHWSLGDMLLFDKKRTEINIALGYHETMKQAFPEKFKGVWYTFHTTELANEQEDFFIALHELLTGKRTSTLYHYIKNENHQLTLLKELSKRWEKTITEDNLALALLELTGKLLNILPDKLYNISEFQEKISKRVDKLIINENQKTITEFEPKYMLSGKEWSDEFIEGIPLLSNRMLLVIILQRIEDETIDWNNPFYHLLIKLRPYPFLLALYCKYLRNK